MVAAALLTVWLTACGGPSNRPAPATDAASPEVMTVRADWNDVDAALEVALSRTEMAILKRTAEPLDDPDLIRYQLLTINNDQAVLTAQREARSGDEMIPIRLEARVGHFGDPSREQALLRSMADRLEQLAGVDYAPVR